MPSSTSADGAQLELLNRIARLAADELELRPMLQGVTDLLQERMGWESIAVISLDAERKTVVVEALSSKAKLPLKVGDSWAVGNGIVGSVALKGEARVESD